MTLLRLFPLAAGLAVALAFALMVAIGSLYPVSHEVVRVIDLETPPEEVWSLVADRAGYPEWVPGLVSVRRVNEEGDVASWVHRGKGGELTVSVETHEDVRRLVSSVANGDAAFVSRWQCEVEPHGAGSRLSVTERGSIPGRIGRFWTHFVFGPEHAIDAWLDAVARALGEDARPRGRATEESV